MFIVEKLEGYQINYLEMNKKFILWYDDLEEAGITEVFVAFSEDQEIIGFQSINADNQCVAIEVIPEYQNKGVALALIDFSKCSTPERNENESFWKKISILEKVRIESKLDSILEVKKYFISHKHSDILGYSVIISVTYDGEVSFTVDGCCEIDSIPIMAGACIFRWLKKAWEETINDKNVSSIGTLFCYPTKTDGGFSRRFKAFSKVGFKYHHHTERLEYSFS